MKQLTILLALFFVTTAQASNGLIKLKSQYDVETTVERLENALVEKGMMLLTRINHAQAAKDVSIKLRPTQLLIFGNPAVGSKLMQCSQTSGIDLPLKALITEDEQGQVWFTYNDPSYIATRHQAEGCDKLVENMGKAMAGFARAATQR
ncbi:putative exported protein [Vibrio astriarenae]|nr:putative exported protein [Vibrio sp. C7]